MDPNIVAENPEAGSSDPEGTGAFGYESSIFAKNARSTKEPGFFASRFTRKGRALKLVFKADSAHQMSLKIIRDSQEWTHPDVLKELWALSKKQVLIVYLPVPPQAAHSNYPRLELQGRKIVDSPTYDIDKCIVYLHLALNLLESAQASCHTRAASYFRAM